MIRDAASFAMGYRIGLALKEHTIIAQEEEGPWLTFRSPEPFTLAVYNAKKNWDGTLEYSTNTKNWTVWDGTTTLASGTRNSLYLRGNGNTVITGLYSDARFVIAGSLIECNGDIRTLLDYTDVDNTVMASYCFNRMFQYCNALVSTPALPALTLSSNCYNSMFNSCRNLKRATALPALTLANSCYAAMFTDCVSLETLIALPAQTIANYCYNEMFKNCSLIKLSESATGNYDKPYRLPTSGIILNAGVLYPHYNMFQNTGGTWTGTPAFNTAGQSKTYYTSNEVI